MTPSFVLATPLNPVCDFCYLGPVVWSYPAKPFVLHLPGKPGTRLPDGINVESPGDWAACQACHDLIEAGDRAGLAVRAAEAIPNDQPQVSLEDLIAVYQHMHGEFFRHAAGPCEAVK